MAVKKFYWLKLKNDFFKSRAMKKLRKIAGGDTYTIIYLKLQLMSLKDEGHLFSEFIEDDLVDELALELDEEIENVRATLMFLSSCGLAEIKEHEIVLPAVKESTGSESESAARVRKLRAREKKALHCNNSVTGSNEIVTTEKEIKLDIEKEKEVNIDIKTKKNKSLSLEKVKDYLSIMRNKTLYLKIIEFYHYRKEILKPLKTLNPIKGMINNIGSEYVNEDHLIKCIDLVMEKEWQGVKGEYVKYSKPQEEVEVVW